MSSTCRAHRLHRFVPILIIVTVGVLSGCLRYTQSLTIHHDDTVSGIVVMAARAPDPASASQPPTPPPGAALPEPQSGSPNIVVAPFAHGAESGYKVTFSRASFEEVAAFAPLSGDGGALLITRRGDELQIVMTVDLTYDLSEQGKDYISTHADTTVSLQAPGRVIDTNGHVSGDTIAWTLKPFEVNTITATLHAPVGATVAPQGRRSIDPTRAAVLGVAAILALAMGWLTLRRYRPAPATGGVHRAGSQQARTALPAGHAAAPGVPDPVAEPGLEASRVRPGHQLDGGGWPPPRPLWREHR